MQATAYSAWSAALRRYIAIKNNNVENDSAAALRRLTLHLKFFGEVDTKSPAKARGQVLDCEFKIPIP